MDGSLSVPEQVGPYRVLNRLDTGGLTELYLAQDTTAPGEQVLLRRIRPDLLDRDPLIRRSVRLEADLGRRLFHPNLVQVLDYLEAEGQPWLVLEPLDGLPLSALLAAAGGPLEPSAAIEIARQLCEGLGALHGALDARGGPLSLVHQQVGPANICVTRRGDVKLLELGIVRGAAAEAGVLREEPEAGLSRSPEQSRGMQLTAASDQYAAGVVVLEMLSGTPFSELLEALAAMAGRGGSGQGGSRLDSMPPTEGPLRQEWARRQLPAHLRDLGRLPGVGLEEILGRMLAYTPGERYPSIRDASADLLRWAWGLGGGIDLRSYLEALFARTDQSAGASLTTFESATGPGSLAPGALLEEEQTAVFHQEEQTAPFHQEEQTAPFDEVELEDAERTTVGGAGSAPAVAKAPAGRPEAVWDLPTGPIFGGAAAAEGERADRYLEGSSRPMERAPTPPPARAAGAASSPWSPPAPAGGAAPGPVAPGLSAGAKRLRLMLATGGAVAVLLIAMVSMRGGGSPGEGEASSGSVPAGDAGKPAEPASSGTSGAAAVESGAGSTAGAATGTAGGMAASLTTAGAGAPERPLEPAAARASSPPSAEGTSARTGGGAGEPGGPRDLEAIVDPKPLPPEKLVPFQGKRRAGSAGLSISTSPQGAKVILDGVMVEQAPVIWENLPAGQHQVILRYEELGIRDVALIDLLPGREWSVTWSFRERRWIEHDE